jgi:hypothetical protein
MGVEALGAFVQERAETNNVPGLSVVVTKDGRMGVGVRIRSSYCLDPCHALDELPEVLYDEDRHRHGGDTARRDGEPRPRRPTH